jgi:AraC-like DNA-binding protein
MHLALVEVRHRPRDYGAAPGPGRSWLHQHGVIALHTACAGWCSVGSEQIRLDAPPLLIAVAPGELNVNRMHGRNEAWWVRFAGDLLVSAAAGTRVRLDVDGRRSLHSHARPLDPAEATAVLGRFRRLRDLWRRASSEAGIRLQAHAELAAIVAVWASPVPAQAAAPLDQVELYRQLIEQTADDGAVRLDHLAARVGAHPDHLARRFRAAHGCTPVAYRTGVRMRLAARLIAAGQPLADVAAAVGCPNVKYFSRIHRKFQGRPPLAGR